MEGPSSFDILPSELLSYVFAFLPTCKDLVLLSRVCKKFYIHLNEDEWIWRYACMVWSARHDMFEKTSLEIILQECKSLQRYPLNWRFFGLCIARENRLEGLTCVYDKNAFSPCMEIGFRKAGK